MRLTTILFAALLLTVATVAKADSFQFTINSSVQEYMNDADNDNYMEIYSTPRDAWGGLSTISAGTLQYGNSPFSNISFSIPEGNVITSAHLYLIFSSAGVQGPADAAFYPGRAALHPPDTDNPISIPATIGSATAGLNVVGLNDPIFSGIRTEGDSTIIDLSSELVINGDEVYSIFLDDINLSVDAVITANIETNGYNYASYVGGSAQLTLPYELEVTGTYSPVPEPSNIALLGTGLLGLASIARYKYIA
jgi:hypothetical protein